MLLPNRKIVFLCICLLTGFIALHQLHSNAYSVVSTIKTQSITIDMASPVAIGGASGMKDKRDIDMYPMVAYDAVTQRYLVVWISLQNARSNSDGFDVYGRFLDARGNPLGEMFRISDENSAARSNTPSIVAGNGEFIVSWSKRNSTCQVVAQRVTDTQPQADQVIASGSTHSHSPVLTYHAIQDTYVLAYVDGDDYLPLKISGSSTEDCGSNVSSTSQIRAVTFHTEENDIIIDQGYLVSDGNGGAFRPHMAYNADLQQYLVVWEDRRNATANDFRFDVYAQRFDNMLTPQAGNIVLAETVDYTNIDTSSNWTPRPVIAAGDSGFMVAWFEREGEQNAPDWLVMGSMISAQGTPAEPFQIASMSFGEPHVEDAPTGMLTIAFIKSTQEYLVGIVSHMETLWGYFSSSRIQRVDAQGNLLNLDGTLRSEPEIGDPIDSSREQQLGMSLSINPAFRDYKAAYQLVYAKNPVDHSETDFEIWGAQISFPSEQQPVPTPTTNPDPTPTTNPDPTPTTNPDPTPTTSLDPTPTTSPDHTTTLYLPLVIQ